MHSDVPFWLRYRGFSHFLTVASSSRLQVMVGGVLTGLGFKCRLGCRWVGRHLRLIDIWFGTWVRSFETVLPTLVLVSRMQFEERYRVFGHFLSVVSSSRLKTMVGGTLLKDSAWFVGLGVSGTTIVSGSCACPSQSWMSCLLTSSLSLGISSLFCRATPECT